MEGFSHLDENNQPTMVDVSGKNVTLRLAEARSEVYLSDIIVEQFKGGEIISKKGPVFQTAIIAGTMAVKQTANLIPFCHTLNIEGIKINISLEGNTAVVACKVNVSSKTGVEMEALMGAQIAALTIYDMCKAFGHEMRIQNTYLVKKRGGKSDYQA